MVRRMTSVGRAREDRLKRYFCARVHRPHVVAGVTFYPRGRFFPSHEEIPQEFVDRFRGGFLHDASRCSVTFSNLFLDACAGVKLSCTRSGPSLAFSIQNTVSSSHPVYPSLAPQFPRCPVEDDSPGEPRSLRFITVRQIIGR